MPRTYVLRIFLNKNQRRVIGEASRALTELIPTHRVGLGPHGPGCTVVRSYWRGWPTMLPQHGRGRKHRRNIALEPWQETIVAAHPDQFLRGCIDSDGCRHRRIVRGKNYPAYTFSHRSKDILELFARVCRMLGLHYTRPRPIIISIARRPDVSRLDLIMSRAWDEVSDRYQTPSTPVLSCPLCSPSS